MASIADDLDDTLTLRTRRDLLDFSTPQQFFAFFVEGRMFPVQRQLVFFHSAFIREHFSGSDFAGVTHPVMLHGIEVEVFAIFISWLYRQKLFRPGPDKASLDLGLLEAIWMLGHRWKVPRLQNDAMREIPAAFKAATLDPAKEADLKRFMCDEYLNYSDAKLNAVALDLAVCWMGQTRSMEKRRWFLNLLSRNMWNRVTERFTTKLFDLASGANRFAEEDIRTFFVPNNASRGE